MGFIRIPSLIDENRPIIIYGGGNLALLTLEIWPATLPKPLAIIDKHHTGFEDNICGVQIQNLDYLQSLSKSNPQIILAAFKANLFEIYSDINKYGFEISATAYDVFEKYIPKKFSNGWGMENQKSQLESDINTISALFSDCKSKEILYDVALWRGSRKIRTDIYERIDKESSKYVNEITKKYIEKASLIIDGGSFNGESSEDFSQITPNNCRFCLYEPDPTSFMRIKSHKFSKIEPYIFNLALTDNICSDAPFFSTGGLSSRLVENLSNSNYLSKTTTIDEEIKLLKVFGNESVLIKLHIEGAEYNALRGAAQTVKHFKPAWIINCSHNMEQLIEIPKFLAYHGYKTIFIRCHSLFGEGLTLYALP